MFGACALGLVGYGANSIYQHAVEIYQIIQFLSTNCCKSQTNCTLSFNQEYGFLNNFNGEAASTISKLTFNLLNPHTCQIIVKFCLDNREYLFYGVKMGISNVNTV